MNRFVVHENPITAAEMLCDQHILKMPTEEIQMLVSGLLANGAPPVLMPIAKSTGKPHKGGYKNHPTTIWTGLNRSNFFWAVKHCKSLCEQFKMRYGKEHFAEKQLAWIMSCTIDDIPLYYFIPKGKMTPFPVASTNQKGATLTCWMPKSTPSLRLTEHFISERSEALLLGARAFVRPTGSQRGWQNDC